MSKKAAIFYHFSIQTFSFYGPSSGHLLTAFQSKILADVISQCPAASDFPGLSPTTEAEPWLLDPTASSSEASALYKDFKKTFYNRCLREVRNL